MIYSPSTEPNTSSDQAAQNESDMQCEHGMCFAAVLVAEIRYHSCQCYLPRHIAAHILTVHCSMAALQYHMPCSLSTLAYTPNGSRYRHWSLHKTNSKRYAMRHATSTPLRKAEKPQRRSQHLSTNFALTQSLLLLPKLRLARHLWQPNLSLRTVEFPSWLECRRLIKRSQRNLAEIILCLLLRPVSTHHGNTAALNYPPTSYVHIVLPHSLQNSLYENDPDPLSALCTCTFPPIIRRLVTGTFTVTPNTLPNVFLQLVQWHTVVRASSLLLSRMV